MGYAMYQVGTSFYIAAENVPACIWSVYQLRFERGLSFPDNVTELDSNWDLEDALDEWSWIPRFDSAVNVVELHFEGGELTTDHTLFQTIAPYVKAGSYIQMIGEDHTIWRWFFDGYTCQEDLAELAFSVRK